jgi:sugar/nucleoside kinase (ribokinase family)
VADDLRLEPGGGANFLIAGARLGQPMAALGALGDDHWGRQVIDVLQAEGIDVSGVTRSGRTTTVVVLVGQRGEHVFLGKYGHGSKIEVSPSALDVVGGAGAIFCAGYTLCESRLVDLALAVAQQAKRTGIPLYFDPGPQMGGVPPAVWQALLPLVDVVLPTEDEIPLLVDGGSVSALLDAGPHTVVVKRGAAGCAIYSRSQPVVDAPGFPVPVVDTSAAGDSFDAAFITGRLRGWSLGNCAKLANAVGAAKVQKLGGGRNVPTLPEVQAVLHQFNISLPPIS